MIGIVILNYNTWNETVECVKSIDKYKPVDSYKIYIVDNNSSVDPTDSELLYLQKNVNVEIINSKINKGYSAGNNIGLKSALNDNCDRILICNSDILFVDDSISEMDSFLKTDSSIGIVGPQIYNKSDEFQPFYMITKLTGLGKIKNMFLHTPFKVLFKNFEKSFIRKSELSSPMKVFGVSGCCFMLNQDCLKYLYPLDERTFLYEEEYIIGAVLEKSKYKVYIIPNTHVIHAHGASTKGMTDFSYKCLINSEQLYLKEYLHTNIVLRKIILTIRLILKGKYTVKGSEKSK